MPLAMKIEGRGCSPAIRFSPRSPALTAAGRWFVIAGAPDPGAETASSVRKFCTKLPTNRSVRTNCLSTIPAKPEIVGIEIGQLTPGDKHQLATVF
jgi:hypothetical protein